MYGELLKSCFQSICVSSVSRQCAKDIRDEDYRDIQNEG